ncbi:hypothetical protein FGG01_00500, partial [Xylella fastidiosa subsp. multiplex]|nr:hypothetical protein [Xylella fastidiosa subsp. multiplex]
SSHAGQNIARDITTPQAGQYFISALGLTLVIVFPFCLFAQNVPPSVEAYLEQLRQLPCSVQQALNLEPQITGWAECFASRHHALFLGRG